MPKNNGGDSGQEWVLLAYAGALMFAPWFAWKVGHTYISLGFIYACKYLLDLNIIINSYLPDFIISSEVAANSQQWLDIIPNISYASLSFTDLLSCLNTCGHSLRIFVFIYIIFLLRSLFSRTKPYKRTNVISFDDLIKNNCKYFPQIRPPIIENPLAQSPDTGVFARESSPVRFCVINKALKYIDTNDSLKTLTFNEEEDGVPSYKVIPDNLPIMNEIVHDKCYLDVSVIEKVFIVQLGGLWTSPDDLSDELSCLYAALLCICSGDKVNYAKLIMSINKTWTKTSDKEGDFYSCKPGKHKHLIDKYSSNRDIVNIHNSHAYVATVFSALMAFTVNKGKCISSDFIWLKVHNRTLWYTLNQVGGRTAWSEASGPSAHYLSEVKLGESLRIPCVSQASSAMMDYLKRTEGWLNSGYLERLDEASGVDHE